MQAVRFIVPMRVKKTWRLSMNRLGAPASLPAIRQTEEHAGRDAGAPIIIYRETSGYTAALL
jgi:hypothetical protein